MSTLPLPLDFNNADDKNPTPIRVSVSYGFDLQHYEPSEEYPVYLYSVQDWIKGVAQTSNARQFWTEIKKRTVKMAFTVHKMPYLSSNGKTYQMDFVNDEVLYRITQQMDTTTGIRNDVLTFLAKAGVKMDEYRLNPEAAVDDAMGQYHIEGKSDSWVEARIQSVITRKQFTDALKDVVINAPANLYSAGTEQIYAGLWQLTTAQLRGELGLKPKQNIRDAFGEYALIYTRLAEMVSTEQLRNAEIVPMSVAMEIVYKVAGMIRGQAQETARLLGIDLITGRKLLKG